MNAPEERQDLPHSRHPHVYAVVRWDPGPGQPEDHLSITKVFRSQVKAADEVRRLTAINLDKGCRYFVMQTRMVEDA